MGDIFNTKRTYSSALSIDDVRAIVQKRSAEKVFSWARNYRGYYRNDQFLLISQKRMSVKITGSVWQTSGGVRMEIRYRPSIHPLAFFIPVLVLMVYVALNTRYINEELVSRPKAMLFTAGVYLLFTAIASLYHIWVVTEERELMEKELRLTIIR